MAFTYFFRDRQVIELIAQHALPDLKMRCYINVWDAGCAMGPEPYSLAITFRENMGPFLFRNVRIYATDIDESNTFGQIIAHGIYSERETKRIPAKILSRYFAPVAEPVESGFLSVPDLTGFGKPVRSPQSSNGRYFQVIEEIRKAITFQKHDLLSLKPVREEFGLIVCKNVLLHFTPEQRVEIIKMFHAALSEEGYFVTEQTQKLPPETAHLFRQVTSAGQLFQKQATESPTCRGEGKAVKSPTCWGEGKATESPTCRGEGKAVKSPTCRGETLDKSRTPESLCDTQHAGNRRLHRNTHHAPTAPEERTEVRTTNPDITITPDTAFERVSSYTWLNIEAGETRLGKIRARIAGQQLTIYSLSIYPEFEGNGYARKIVSMFQQNYDQIIADRVRPPARGFWERMNFENDGKGNYAWKNVKRDT